MKTNIGFRVTGMFFGAKGATTGEIRVDVPVEILADGTERPTTVYDVMVEVAKKVDGGGVIGVDYFSFDPPTPSPTDSINSITVSYTQPPKAGYDAGVYFLQENKMGNPIHVFQYYIFDGNNKQKNNNNTTAQFNAKPDAPIEDGDTIVWREIAIMQAPNGRKRVKSEMKTDKESIKSAY